MRNLAVLIGVLALQELEKDWQSLKRIDDRKQRRKCADEQGQYLPHAGSCFLPAFRGLEFALPQRTYFVTIRRDTGAAGLGAAGEIWNVNQAFQPSARFSAANSL